MKHYKVCLKRVATGEVRVRRVNWTEAQFNYYSKMINRPIEGITVLWVEPILN